MSHAVSMHRATPLSQENLIGHVGFSLLSQQKTKSLLASQSLFAEFVIRRKSGRVGGGGGNSSGVFLLHGVDTLALGIEVEHEVHGGKKI